MIYNNIINIKIYKKKRKKVITCMKIFNKILYKKNYMKIFYKNMNKINEELKKIILTIKIVMFNKSLKTQHIPKIW